MNKPLKERRKFLVDNMQEVGNRIKLSEIQEIKKKDELGEMIKDTFRKGLEGLMVKDKKSTYEPGKRHWLKVIFSDVMWHLIFVNHFRFLSSSLKNYKGYVIVI